GRGGTHRHALLDRPGIRLARRLAPRLPGRPSLAHPRFDLRCRLPQRAGRLGADSLGPRRTEIVLSANQIAQMADRVDELQAELDKRTGRKPWERSRLHSQNRPAISRTVLQRDAFTADWPFRALQAATLKPIAISAPMNAWKRRNLCGLADYRKKRKLPIQKEVRNFMPHLIQGTRRGVHDPSKYCHAHIRGPSTSANGAAVRR